MNLCQTLAVSSLNKDVDEQADKLSIKKIDSVRRQTLEVFALGSILISEYPIKIIDLKIIDKKKRLCRLKIKIDLAELKLRPQF